MAETKYDVLGIGNAIVDVLAAAEEAFLREHGLNKGSMQLLDADEAERLYAAMGPGVEVSGGSAANTIAGLASLGSRTAFVGKVKVDTLGEIFAHDIRALGVHFTTPMARSGPSTARCLILVTPDAQRTMNTFLGACVTLGPGDVAVEEVRESAVTYLEGYLWDPPAAKEAFRKASQAAHAAGRKVALTLSDAFCVDRYRDEFRALIETDIDLLFANEAEICSLYESATFDEAIQNLRHQKVLAAITRSEKGSVVLRGDEMHILDAETVEHLVDTTGAGDQYAAGFLFGYTRGFELARCGALGGVAAAEVISHYGARPETSLQDLARARGLL
jgi:sugar/nucleoside kinase (ribokinase family)